MPKLLISAGIMLIGLGLIWEFLLKTPFLGKLPGDIFLQKKNFSFYFPVTTSIILSLILSLVLWIFSKRQS